MKIALTTGIILKEGGKDSIGLGYYPQLGLGYLAAVLKRKGHEVFLYDALPVSSSPQKVAQELLKQSPDIIAFSVITTSYPGALAVAEIIKESKEIPIIFGGPHCTYFPEETLNEANAIDYLIIKEGEIAFSKLIDAIAQHSSYQDVPQLYYKNKNGTISKNLSAEMVDDLDTLPFPSWEMIDPKLYTTKECSMISSRGCPHSKCLFCMRTGPLYVPFRRRSVDNVIAEIQYTLKSTPFRKVLFFDDNFAYNEGWISDFCNKLIKNKIDIKWSCNGRADTVTEKMLKEMKRAGCFVIRYGIETGVQELLDFFEKGLTLKQIRTAVWLTRKAGIKALGFFMIGLPKETPEDAKKSIRFALDLKLDFFQMVPYKPEFGTSLYHICKEEGTILNDPSYFYYCQKAISLLTPAVSYLPQGFKSQRTIKKILRNAYLRFYLRPQLIVKIILMLFKKEKNPVDIFKHIKQAFLFITRYFR